MKLVLRLLRWANLVLVLATLAAYWSPYADPQQFWPLAFAGLLYPFLLLGNLLFIILWGLLRKFYLLLSLVCVLAGWTHLRSLIGWSRSQPSTKPVHTLNIMTFNAHGMQLDHSRAEVSQEQIAAVLPANIDLVALQEYSPRNDRRWREFVQQHTGMHYQMNTGGALTIFSRYPIVDSETIYTGHRSNGYQWADIQAPGQRIRVFNLHLQSNAITWMTEQMVSQVDENPEALYTLRGIMGRYRHATRERAEQAKVIRELIEASPYPVLVLGDFNDIPQSYVYRAILGDLQDSFKKAGSGIGFTYAGIIPGLRIDYILVDPGLEVLTLRKGKRNYSDHYPVLGVVAWLKE